MPLELGERRRTWESVDPPRMRVIIPVKGTASLFDLRVLAEDLGVDQTELSINHPSAVSWLEPPTAADTAQRLAHELDRRERREQWELKTYERLRAKFEGAS